MQQKRRLKRLIIPIFINHKGCPHRCIFCSQKSAVEDYNTPIEKIPEVIESYISTQIKKFGEINPKYEITQIAFYGGSFTCLGFDFMEKYFSKVEPFFLKYKINSIRISTRPDCVNQEILDFLKIKKVKTVEIGAECFDDNILKILKRGHTVNDIINACKLIKENNLELSIQLMVGLPEENEKIIEKNLKYLKEIKPDFLRIFPLIVLKNTELEKMYYEKKYTPISLENAVKILSKFYNLCEREGINIIQMGLHYSEHLVKNYVAGPLHPAIKDLVMNKVDIHR